MILYENLRPGSRRAIPWSGELSVAGDGSNACGNTHDVRLRTALNSIQDQSDSCSRTWVKRIR